MKKPLLLAASMVFAFASFTLAGTSVERGSKQSAIRSLSGAMDKNHGADGHPLAQPVANHDVRIEIVKDDIFRSCCKPPDLVVSGTVTNRTPRPINYVRLAIAMKNASGQVVYSEDTYNHGAVTLFEDPTIAKILNEKPHFDPLAAGASDTFVFSIPVPVIPSYKSVSVLALDVVRGAAIAGSH